MINFRTFTLTLLIGLLLSAGASAAPASRYILIGGSSDGAALQVRTLHGEAAEILEQGKRHEPVSVDTEIDKDGTPANAGSESTPQGNPGEPDLQFDLV